MAEKVSKVSKTNEGLRKVSVFFGFVFIFTEKIGIDPTMLGIFPGLKIRITKGFNFMPL